MSLLSAQHCLPDLIFLTLCTSHLSKISLKGQKVILLTLVRSWTASKADLYGVLVANWKPQTSTCSQTFHLHCHHSTSNYPADEAPLTLCFYCHSQQRADASSAPRVSETCVPCLCSSGLPQSGRGDQQPKSTQNTKKAC